MASARGIFSAADVPLHAAQCTHCSCRAPCAVRRAPCAVRRVPCAVFACACLCLCESKHLNLVRGSWRVPGAAEGQPTVRSQLLVGEPEEGMSCTCYMLVSELEEGMLPDASVVCDAAQTVYCCASTAQGLASETRLHSTRPGELTGRNSALSTARCTLHAAPCI